jgi:hypothetical protein
LRGRRAGKAKKSFPYEFVRFWEMMDKILMFL